jgi:hypothetical protein
MKQLTSPEFRKKYTSLNEQVEVTVFNKVIGWWTPAGADIEVPTEVTNGEETVTESESPPHRFTIRPAKRPMPVMTTTEKRVLDPLEMRKQAQARDDEFMSRTFGRRPSKS